MKKILYSLFIFTCLFISSYKVNALTCEYYGEIKLYSNSKNTSGTYVKVISDSKEVEFWNADKSNKYVTLKETGKEFDLNDLKIQAVDEFFNNFTSSCPSSIMLSNTSNEPTRYSLTLPDNSVLNNAYIDAHLLNEVKTSDVVSQCTKTSTFHGDTLTLNFKKYSDNIYEYCVNGNDTCYKFEQDNTSKVTLGGYQYSLEMDEDAVDKLKEAMDNKSCDDINVSTASDDTRIIISDLIYTPETVISNQTAATMAATIKLNLMNLNMPLSFALSEKGKSLSSYSIDLDGNGSTVSLESIGYGSGICSNSEDCNNPSYADNTVTGLNAVKEACNNMYKNYSTFTTDDYNKLATTCKSFDTLYNQLISEGIVSDLTEGCGFVSQDLLNELNKILNIIKIAGPVLAILLGMLDFAKVVAEADPEKGYKDALKRFKNRLIAAALLFLTPVLLSMAINMILGSSAYNNGANDNPFCDVGVSRN